jgi:hypothetical protein
MFYLFRVRVMTTNIISLYTEDGRKESWNFPDGTIVTIEVPKDEPPITVKHAVFCLSDVLHQIHGAMHAKA